MMRRLSRAVLFLLLGAAPLFAEPGWKIAETQSEASPNESIEHRTTTVEEAATADRATLHFAVFATRTATLRMIDQPSPPRTDLAAATTRTGALAGVNGGYFDPEDAPVGLLVSEGRVLSPLRKAKLLTGVLWTTQNQVDIARSTHFIMNKKVKSALQCGPLLVERSVPVPGLNDTRPARRTFAAVDGEGRALIGVSSAVTLAQLSRILSVPNLVEKMKITRGLNLDGGSSTAFWFAGKEKAFSIPESKTVRDFVAVVPR
jgi:uncharacterized protein YigE (DUF2233 family)